MPEELDPIQMALRDASKVLSVDERGLSGLSKLAKALLQAQRELEDASELVKLKKARVTQLEQGEIPDLMREMGIKNFTFDDGSVVKVEHKVAVTIRADRQEAAFRWMEDNGHDGIIKSEIVMSYGKGELEDAQRMLRRITKSTNHPVDFERKVHPATLKSWSSGVYFDTSDDGEGEVAVGSRLPHGEDDPFTAFEFSKAEVKLPKQKKVK